VPTGAKGEALTFTRASKSYCTKTGTGGLATSGIANGDLVYMPDNAPRVEYDADAFRGLLVEGARTNSVLRSQELDNASWASNNSVIALPTVTANAATAPDGTVTAERLQIPGSSTAGQYSQIYQLSACPAGTQVGSFYIKGVSGAGSVCWKIGTAVENCSYVSESWTRCTPSINAASSLTVALAVDVSACGANAGGVDAYVWGVQCENGAYATSYIPTTSGTATRAAESAYLTTSVAGPAYSSAGNFQTPYNVTSSSSRVVTLYQDGSHFADDYFSSNFQAFIYDGATDSKTSTTAVTTSGRVGSYFDATSLGVCVNASCESVAATVSYTAWTRVRLGIDGSGGTTGHINGIVSQVCVDPSPTKCR
jgi:hypothetical protein